MSSVNAPSSDCWRTIAVDSNRLHQISSHSRTNTQRIADIKSVPRLSSRSHPSSDSTVCPFPLPAPLTTDFIALGLPATVARRLSLTYIQASTCLKDLYEIEARQAINACSQLIQAHDLHLPQFQHRMQILYEARFMSTVKSWAVEELSLTRQQLMKFSLETRISLAMPPKNFPGSRCADGVADGKVKEDTPTWAAIPDRELQCAPVKKEETTLSPDSGLVDLTPLFQLKSLPPVGLFCQEASLHAFPKCYPCYSPEAIDSCLQILSRGIKRASRPSLQPTNLDSLTAAFKRFSTGESTASETNKVSLNSPPQTSARSAAYPATPPSRSSISPAVTSSPPAVIRPAIFNPLPTPLTFPATDSKPTKIDSVSMRRRKFAAMPKRNHSPTIKSVSEPYKEDSSVFLPSSKPSVQIMPSLPTTLIKTDEQPLLATSSATATPYTLVPRARKVIALPARCAPAASATQPTYTASTSFAPLSVANVSSLSQSSSPSTHSRSTSRTPSLVSLASNDSIPSSSSSNEVDTPPSTPPPLVTTFPMSISSFPVSSLTPKSQSPISSSVFKFSPTQEPKRFEVASPSQHPSSFSFPTGIKQEEGSFSFQFGR
uniref:B2 mating type protein n=1 Tax=Heterobasidion irregulare TaxID=984962 RepID=S5R9Z7_9AGAM|nr:b2 mating type protein [Heterobasidion irregulare]